MLKLFKGVAPGRYITFQQTTPYPLPGWEEGIELGWGAEVERWIWKELGE